MKLVLKRRASSVRRKRDEGRKLSREFRDMVWWCDSHDWYYATHVSSLRLVAQYVSLCDTDKAASPWLGFISSTHGTTARILRWTSVTRAWREVHFSDRTRPSYALSKETSSEFTKLHFCRWIINCEIVIALIIVCAMNGFAGKERKEDARRRSTESAKKFFGQRVFR